MEAWRTAPVKGLASMEIDVPSPPALSVHMHRIPPAGRALSSDDSVPAFIQHQIPQDPSPRSRDKEREQDYVFPHLDRSLPGIDDILYNLEQGDGVQPETHSLFQRGLLASANPALDPGLQRAIDAGWMENVKMGARTPPQAAPRAHTVREHREALRRESKAILSSVWGSTVPAKGTICEVRVKGSGGVVRRRFAVTEWAELGPCVVLSTPDRQHVVTEAPLNGGWQEYMQCSHLRRAGFSNHDCDTLLLSTGMQQWRVHMSASSAEKWLAMIYEYCHWLRPGPDVSPEEGVGVGSVPTDLGAPRPGSPMRANTEPAAVGRSGQGQGQGGFATPYSLPVSPGTFVAKPTRSYGVEREILNSML